MCNHETINISQDGERVVLCSDCGREFGHIMRDESETFVAYAFSSPVLVVDGTDAHEATKATSVDSEGIVERVFPCAKCGFSGRCCQEDEECHS
jgi:hypothetical protein